MFLKDKVGGGRVNVKRGRGVGDVIGQLTSKVKGTVSLPLTKPAKVLAHPHPPSSESETPSRLFNFNTQLDDEVLYQWLRIYMPGTVYGLLNLLACLQIARAERWRMPRRVGFKQRSPPVNLSK
jgi:hypothetical protein